MTIAPTNISPPLSASRIVPSQSVTRQPQRYEQSAGVTSSEPHSLIKPSTLPSHSATCALSINDVNEFFYGYRSVVHSHNGTEAWEQVPLTAQDVMFPQLEDMMPQSYPHYDACTEINEVLRSQATRFPSMVVLSDVAINWNVSDVGNPSPDFAVIADVLELPSNDSETDWFDLAKYCGKPILAGELTSKSTRYMDVTQDDPDQSKYVYYERIGIPYYLVIDMARKQRNLPPPFWGYRLVQWRYRPIIPDQYGRLWIAPLGISLGAYQDRVAWFDAQGNRLLTLQEQEQQTIQEKMRADQEVQARKVAEIQVQSEAQARQAAEARARELEEELRLLKAGLGIRD